MEKRKITIRLLGQEKTAYHHYKAITKRLKKTNGLWRCWKYRQEGQMNVAYKERCAQRKEGDSLSVFYNRRE
jgi:hypothetical protein